MSIRRTGRRKLLHPTGLPVFLDERAEETKIMQAQPSPTAHMGETDP
jgi:hypothetical protein